VVQAAEQFGVTNEELAEVQRDAPVHEIDEHETTRVLLLDADGKLVGKAADRLRAPGSERKVRIFFRTQPGHLLDVEEGPLVAFGTQPPTTSIAQDRIKNHHSFDHSADGAKATVAIVRLPDRLVERLMVDVVQAPSSDGPGLDGSDESAGDQPGHEFSAVLTAHRTGELAILPLQKTSGVDHDGDEELALALRQTVVAQSGHSADADAVQRSVGRVVVRHRNSSIPRGCGPERPPRPREATT
jgi:hypothetical protein